MKMFGLTTGSETKPFAGKACALAVFVAVCALFAQAVEPYQLERDSEDQTAMRSGCTVFLRAHPGDYHKAQYCFDGDTWTTGDLYDNGNYNPIIGVDFGEAVYVSKIRFLTRPDNYEVNRVAGVAVYGCSDASKFPASQTADVSDFYAASVQISYGTIPSGLSNNTWTELECDSSVLCRYVYFWDRVDWQWFGNAAEIQIFGWTAEDIAAENLPTDITGITVSAKPNGTVSVDWVCPGRPESFTVERREMPDGAWAPLASVGGAVKTYDDTTAAYDATYSYRVTAVYESESRVSVVCQTTYLDPAEFSVAPSGDGNAYAVLTWDATGTFADGAKIYRKAGAGAWQVLDEALAGDDSYTDETVLYGGGEYLYRLGPSGSDEMASATVSYYRLKKFAGTALDLNFNHPGQSATLLLDGNLYTYGDIYQNGMGNPALGIDAGEKVFVKKALVYPRQESGYLYRIVGVSVYGNNDTAGLPASSADSAGAFFANETRISGGLPNVLETGRWYELECSTAAAYRYLYLRRPDNDWNGNVAEVEFYGWTEADAALLSPMDVTALAAEAVSGGDISLAWECAGIVSSFTLERKTGDGGYSTIATLPGASRAYTDTTTQYGASYTYRVSARYEQFDATRVSSEATVVCREPVEFAVVNTADRHAYASVSWQNTGAFADGATLLRRTGAEEWTVVGDYAAGVVSCVDTSMQWGQSCEYALAAYGSTDPISAPASFMRMKKLTGFTPIGFDYSHEGQTASAIFDGDPSTYCDIYQNSAGNPALGADFGAGNLAYVAKARLFPRQDDQYIARLAGVAVYGSPLNETNWHDSQAQVSYSTMPSPVRGRWYELECNPSTPYRGFFLQHPYGNWWCGNVAEVEFYGWTARDLYNPFMLIIR